MIGLLEDATFDEGEIELRPGDLLAIVTDGVTEAFSPGDEEFGDERVCDSLRASESGASSRPGGSRGRRGKLDTPVGLRRRSDSSHRENEIDRQMRLFNTLCGQVEPLEPLSPPEIRMYACGLTVYNRGHVGNYRTIVATDVLRRTLRLLGYKVKGVLNITDVDDRIIKQAVEAKQDIAEFTAPWIRAFEEDMATLRIERPEHLPRATEHLPEMIDLIERLKGPRPHLRGGRQCLLPNCVVPRLRAAVRTRRGRDPGRGAGRHRQVRQGERPGLRPMEVQERRARVGGSGRPRSAAAGPAGMSSARR